MRLFRGHTPDPCAQPVGVGGVKNWCFLIPLLLTSACTTIEDFQAMSPDERADTVCGATSASRQRKAELTQLNNEISAKQELLARGYRLYEYCQVVPISFPATAANCTALAGTELETCQRSNTPARTEYRRVCTETPVSIDYNYESSILHNLRMTREDQLEIHDQQTYVCVAKARSLSATDAYSRYKLNAEP